MTAVAEKREPIYVHCAKCGHEWSVGFFPIAAADFGKLNVKRCVLCKKGPVLMGLKPRETPDGDVEAWIANGDTGTSSLTIWAVMMGRRSPHGRFDAPHDPSDFGRCYRLLNVMPSWRARLGEVAARCKAFAPLVPHWDELTALYEEELPSGSAPKLYKRIKELRERAR
jgi:hypothetical protein